MSKPILIPVFPFRLKPLVAAIRAALFHMAQLK